MVASTDMLIHRLLLLAAAMWLLSPWAALAEGAVAELEDAQTACAAPVSALSAELTEAAIGQGADEEMRQQFLSRLEQCRAVYRYHLAKVGADFVDLPASAYCHSVRRDFVHAEYLFDVAASRAEQVPLNSTEDRISAAEFLRDANGALVRAVNGVFLLRHGICMEERIAPFTHPPFESEINRTYPHIE